MHNLNGISHPLDEKLVQAGWDTLTGMDPIMPKYQVVATLHISNKERRCQSLAPDGNSTLEIPLVGIGAPPPTPLTVMLVLINSSSLPPSFL
jgi:hypothetical protein